jgi:2-amino-4-hydroxy-6-hydroxymethyldihydropteridine diphosphokinase
MNYFLCLGSNLGNREANLTNCLIKLKKIDAKVITASSIYETEPVSNCTQPWFLNQVVEIEVDINPFVLLNKIKKIEHQVGRVESELDKSPRIIDIDILLAENKVIHAKNLIIPHPRMHLRNFVLIPLKEIAPEIEHPVLHKTVEVINKSCQDKSKVNVYKLYRHFL